MGRAFVSQETGAAVYILADDHCPPHVHARHRGKGWIARVRFSYIDSGVELISIAPLKGIPLRRALNALLDEVQIRLLDCRRAWWTTRQTACLENQWAIAPAGEGIELRPERSAGAKQIAGARYNIATGRLTVGFWDGTSAEMSGPL